MKPDVSGYRRCASTWQVGPRCEQDHIVYLLLDGFCSGEVRGKRVVLQAGDFMWLPAGVPHVFGDSQRMMLYHIRFQLTQRSVNLVVAADVIVQKNALAMRPFAQQIMTDFMTRPRLYEARMRASLTLLFTTLDELQREKDGRAPKFTAGQRTQLVRHVYASIHQPIEPAALAAQLDLSHDYFTRIFRRTFGQSPRLWIARERMRQAALRLSESTLSVTQIAREFGYEDIFLFSRQFKKALGASPRQYRARQ